MHQTFNCAHPVVLSESFAEGLVHDLTLLHLVLLYPLPQLGLMATDKSPSADPAFILTDKISKMSVFNLVSFRVSGTYYVHHMASIT